MKYSPVIILIIILFFSCNVHRKITKSNSTFSKVEIQYDKSRAKGVMADKNQKRVVVYFMNYFNDTIRVFFNGSLIFRDFVTTDSVSGKSNKFFTYDYSQDLTMPLMKVVSKSGSSFEVQTVKRYKIIYLFFDESQKLTVRFTNRYSVDD